MLDKRGAVLETARRVSRLLREHDLRGAVIGGVAVVLHGHVRTTRDVDVFCVDDLSRYKPIFESAGATFNKANKEFVLDDIPIHLVDADMVKPAPRHFVVIEDVTTIDLPDLINLKLHTGLSKVTRAQDLADVIGLIRSHNLNSTFAARLDKPLRVPFRKLVAAIKRGD